MGATSSGVGGPIQASGRAGQGNVQRQAAKATCFSLRPPPPPPVCFPWDARHVASANALSPVIGLCICVCLCALCLTTGGSKPKQRRQGRAVVFCRRQRRANAHTPHSERDTRRPLAKVSVASKPARKRDRQTAPTRLWRVCPVLVLLPAAAALAAGPV